MTEQTMRILAIALFHVLAFGTIGLGWFFPRKFPRRSRVTIGIIMIAFVGGLALGIKTPEAATISVPDIWAAVVTGYTLGEVLLMLLLPLPLRRDP